MKNWWFGKAKYREEVEEQEKADTQNIRSIMDDGTVEDFELYVRGMRPEIKPHELKKLIADYHRYRAERERDLREAASRRRS